MDTTIVETKFNFILWHNYVLNQSCLEARNGVIGQGGGGGGGGGVVNVGGVKRLTTGEEGHIRHDGSSRLRL